jgi:hypothetical protein
MTVVRGDPQLLIFLRVGYQRVEYTPEYQRKKRASQPVDG